jgi:hypothetical protein
MHEIGYCSLKKFKGFSYDVALTLNTGFNSIVGISMQILMENAVCRGSKCYFAFVKK